MKKVLLIVLLLFVSFILQSQVTTSPLNPTDNEEITIIFDATGSELDGYTGDVYAFTGVTVNGVGWNNIIGADLWVNNGVHPQLTRDAINANLYTLLITPSIFDYYSVSPSDNITELVFTFRSSDGTLQTRPDIFIPIIPTNPPPVILDIWGIVGSFNGWGTISPDLPLSYNEITNNWSAVVTLTDGEIKFRKDNDWSNNYGDNEPDGLLDQGGTNIAVVAGDYLVTINFNSLEYSIKSALVSIPDPNFEQALIDLEIDTNGLTGDILRVDAENATELIANFPLIPDLINGGEQINPFADPRVTITTKIADLTGIDAFINLTSLGVGYNELTSIDLSNNLKLGDVFLNDNLLTSIDISKNTLLTRFGVMRNPTIGTIDVTQNVLLEELFVENTGISTIDLFDNVNLWRLHAQNNILTGVDVSLNSKLTDFRVRFNSELTFVNIKNGNNSNIVGFDIRDTQNLTCVTADGIAEPEVSSLMLGYSNGLLSTDCGTVYIPDPNFEQALIDSSIDTSQVLDGIILRSEAEGQTGRLDVCCRGISDLTGVEAFVNITELQAGENNLTKIDISKNTELIKIWTYFNPLTSLDLSNNTKLQRISVGGNELTELDVSMLPDLHAILAWQNQLTSIDVSNNPLLDWLHIETNQVSSVDVSNNPLLTYFRIHSNQVFSIDVSNNPLLDQLDIGNNPNLSHLDMRNGNNSNIISFYAENIPLLTCINSDATISQVMTDSGKTFSEDCGDFVYIPDPNFEQSLIDLGIDSDGVVNTSILRSDAEAVTELNVGNPLFVSDSRRANPLIVNVTEKIADLTGIEAFTNLTLLSSWSNALTEIDVTQNVLLERLELVDNQIANIDVTKNTELTILWLESNALASVDISQNAKLVNLAIGYNSFTSLDVTNNPDLWAITAEDNNITEIDISNNLKLVHFWVFNNPNYNKVDVSKQPLLSSMGIWNTSITTLDLSNNPSFNRLYAADNFLLEHLDIRNENNLNVTAFNVGNTPNLTCINADATISQTMTDSGKTFSQDCGDFVYIPDPNFEQALIDLGIDSDGVVNTSVLRSDAEAQTGHLGVSNKEISDLAGVEAFINITELQAGQNNLTEIDVSQNTALTKIWVYRNQLTSLDLSSNILMQRISAGGNQLTSLDVTNLPEVHTIYTWENQISTIDLSGNPILDRFDISDNLITNIDFTSNSQLTWVRITNNSLTSINISENTLLQYFNIGGNNLSQLDISNNQQLNWLEAQYNTGLKLITVPITGSPTLTALDLSGTGLSNFNPTLYPNLEILWLNENSISKLNTSNIPNLTALVMNDNELGVLDLSSNTILQEVQLKNNLLTSLDMRNGNNIGISRFWVENNLLTCINVDNPDDITIPYSTWEIDTGVILSLDCRAEPEVILIPDVNFEIVLSAYDTNGMNGNILLSDAQAILNLDVNSASITDLTGIEGFVNLTDLNVSNNLLGTINLLENIDLVNVDVSQNLLTELFINSGRKLATLNCSENQLTTLNFADLTDLEIFNASTNQFTSFDASGHNLLTSFNVSANDLTELDMRNGNNSLITFFDATNNSNLVCIGVDDENNVPNTWIADAIYTNSGDCFAPTVMTQSIIVELDRYGLATITSSDIDNGSFDNVSQQRDLIFSLDITGFDCSSLGDNTVILSVTDEAGNTNSETAIVTIIDIIVPAAKSLRTYTYDLNGAAGYTLDATMIDDGSTDNCQIESFSLDQEYFSSPGTYSVIFYATDISGNSSTDITTVEIIDSAISGEELKFGGLTLTVYPVPFSDVINISFSRPTDLNTVFVSLLDINGIDTGIQFSPNGQNLISDNTTGLTAPATYILQVTIGSKTKTVQIMNQ